MSHFDNCSAPICQEQPENNKKVVWYPGEPVCKLKPYKKFQEKQTEINALYRAGKIKMKPFTLEELDSYGE